MNKQAHQEGVKRISLDLLLSRRSPPRQSAAEGAGVSPIELLDLPDNLQVVMRQAMRLGVVTIAQVVETTGSEQAEAAELLEALVARGSLSREGAGVEATYKPLLGKTRRPRLSSGLWEALESKE
jgi:hypothetical protein